jgi:hypothetical protein
MKKLQIILLGLALAAPALSYGAGGISGSPHDFSTNSWNIGTSGANAGRKATCGACHSAHNTDIDQTAPLWNHADSTLATYKPYSSPSLDATVTQPTGVSLACLSCHDGTVAVNAKIDGTFTGGSAVFIDSGAVISQDLHTTHPISFDYTTGLAAKDGGLENPETYLIGAAKTTLTVQTAPVPSSWSGTSLTGKSIKAAMLVGDRMECSSCHDVHRLAGSSPTSGILARISGTDTDNRGSLLCRTCHVK